MADQTPMCSHLIHETVYDIVLQQNAGMVLTEDFVISMNAHISVDVRDLTNVFLQCLCHESLCLNKTISMI